MACGSSTVSPQPGITPTREWVSPNLARSDAIRKSQFSASSNPPVMATPLIAPMSGLVTFGNGPRVPVELRVPSAPLPPPRLPADDPSSLRSSPAQNAGSAPVRISTSTSSSASASCITLGSRASSSLDSALRALGRLSVMVAMRSLTSSSTGAAVSDVVRHGRILVGRAPAATGGWRRDDSLLGAAVLGGEEGEAQVAEAHERRRDPAAEGAEVLVEQRAGAVGERLLGQLVEPLVGDLDGVLELDRVVVVELLGRDRGGRSRSSSPARSRRPSPISGLDSGSVA